MAPRANKLRKTHKLTSAPLTGATADFLTRIRERIESEAAAGLIADVAALQLRAELGRLSALRRLLRKRRSTFSEQV